MNIDTSIPNYSPYFLYANVPFTFALRHFEISFASRQTNPELSLSERVKHFCLGLVLALPIINVIASIAERCLFPPKSGSIPIQDISEKTQQNISETPQIQNMTNEPPPSPQNNKKNQELMPAERIKEAVQKVTEQQKNNQFYKVNAMRIEPAKDHLTKFYQYIPLAEAIKEGNINELGKILECKNLTGLNERIMNYMVVEGGGGKSYYETPLIYAVKHKKLDLFKKLLAHPKIDININHDEHGTALHEACRLGQEGGPFIEELIAKKANPLIKANYYVEGDIKNVTPLNLAKIYKVPDEYFNKLENWTNLNSTNDLHKQIGKENLGKIETEIKAEICLEVREVGLTPLQLAVNNFIDNPSKEVNDIVMFLLEKGSYVNVENIAGQTPLYLLCNAKPEGWEDIAKALIDHGAEIERPSRTGYTPLHFLLELPDDHKIKKHVLEQDQGKYQEYQNRRNTSTLLGIESTTRIGGKSVDLRGGNQPEIVYQILQKALDAFIKEEDSEEVKTNFTIAEKSVKLANKLLQQKEIDDVLTQEVSEADFPVIIPSGWPGHAFAVILYRGLLIIANRGEREKDTPAVRIFSYQNKFTKETLSKIILKSKANKELNVNNYEKFLEDNLNLSELINIELKDQKGSNCTWASSASLGLRTTIALLKTFGSHKTEPTNEELKNIVKNFSDEAVKRQMKKFNQFAKSWQICESIKYLNKNISTIPIGEDKRLLAKVAGFLLKKIQIGKDSCNFYKKALDCLTFSGFKLDGMELSEQLTNYYAELYQISIDDLLNLREKCIGDWELST